MSKRPAIRGEAPDIAKRARALHVPDANKYPPAWRISVIETVDPFGWHVLGRAKLDEIRLKLAGYEQKTWTEILVQDKRWNHAVEVSRLSRDARKRLADISQDDVDELVSLHLSGKERVWGIRDGFVLRLLWWDPDHRVCPSLLRHT